MAMHSDDEKDISRAPRPTSSATSRTFDFDDAFSDTDDDPPFEFSPAAIRKDLEKSLSSHKAADNGWPTDHDLSDLAGKIGYAHDTDASVSTFDIDADHEHVLSPPTQQPPSPVSRTTSHNSVSDLDEMSLSNDFSTVNLESPDPNADPPAAEGEQSDEELQYASYPAVEIDASEDLPTPSVLRGTTPPPPESDHSPSPSSSPHGVSKPDAAEVTLPITPKSSQSLSFSSTASLPMTAELALPTPNSAQSPQSNASSSSFNAKHRASRSVGPSMLDKVVSKTRPSFLPPKPRAEDRKHMADWETMMKHSRVAGESG